MKSTPATPPAHRARRRPRLGRPRLLIVGCGDIGLRIVARLHQRFRIFAVTASSRRVDSIRAAGAVPLVIDLDHSDPRRLHGLAARIIYLVPPSPTGDPHAGDRRLGRLLAVLRSPRGPFVYVSTTGVYGNRDGNWVDESSVPAPSTDRAWRRVWAERRARAHPWRASVLRSPGIYGPGRLPLERLRRATPVPSEPVMTSHIHADDLARIGVTAVFRAAPRRVYNAVDDSCLSLGDYLDLVADRAGLPRPPRRPTRELGELVTPIQLSFMSESRRIRNHRIKSELRIRLVHSRVGDALDSALAGSAVIAETREHR